MGELAQTGLSGGIRNDKVHGGEVDLERLKAELAVAFAEPKSGYLSLTPDELIARNGTLRCPWADFG